MSVWTLFVAISPLGAEGPYTLLNLENLFSNTHSHDEYFCTRPLSKEISHHAKYVC